MKDLYVHSAEDLIMSWTNWSVNLPEANVKEGENCNSNSNLPTSPTQWMFQIRIRLPF